MDFLLSTPGFILMFAVLLGASFLWGKLTDSAWSKANQHVFSRGKHKRGQEQMATNLGFSTAASPEMVRDMIIRSIPTQDHGVMNRTFSLEVQHGNNGGWNLIYTYGNMVSANFRTMVAIERGHGGTGSQGFIGVIEALTADGVLTHPDEMAQWRQTVVNAIRGVDAYSQFTEMAA